VCPPRISANNWARGYKTYRRGDAVGFVPALDRLTVRQISNRYLSEEERRDDDNTTLQNLEKCCDRP
jgi:hypothetical protein